MNIYGWIGIDANAPTNLPFVLVVSCDSYKASLCPFDVSYRLLLIKRIELIIVKEKFDYSVSS